MRAYERGLLLRGTEVQRSDEIDEGRDDIVGEPLLLTYFVSSQISLAPCTQLGVG
jgi:hypothetical protein